MNSPIILGIETSCDDTSICLLKKTNELPQILAFETFGQGDLLKKWGGVVPELASRNHLEKLAPLLKETFDKANIHPKEVSHIAVTTHPGLLGPLLTGLNAAKTLSLLYQLPIISINHLYAHIEAIFLSEESKNITYPYLGLLVSGGHTLILKANSSTSFEILGTTIDDAAGEAFDKGGKLMGLGYPAGKIIDDLARLGDPKRFEFPIGLKTSGDGNFSYSGLKTSLRNFLEKNESFMVDEETREKILLNPTDASKDLKDLCASYQHAIVMALKLKLKTVIKKQGLSGLDIVVGGGVACNSYLRSILKENFKKVYFVAPKFCTDNGAMIAHYGLRTLEKAILFPKCLELDSHGRFISKDSLLKAARSPKTL